MTVRLDKRGCLGLGSAMTCICAVAVRWISVAYSHSSSRARSVIDDVLLIVNAILIS